MKRISVILKTAALAALIGVPAAFGGTYTTPVTVGDGPTKEALFEGIYGGDWTLVTLNEKYTLGTITAQRVFDAGGVEPIYIDGSNATTADDQIWKDGIVNGSAEARYAGYSQTFGYVAGPGPGGSFTTMFATSGSGFGITGSAAFDFSSFATGWRWARDGTTTSTSLEGDTLNVDSLDHMITFAITDSSKANPFISYLLFFDDQTLGGDRDFNDLVVEVKVVPTPTAALAGLPLLGGMFAFGLKRKRALMA